MPDILSITGPIYLVILLGYLVTRAGLFGKPDMRVFGKFVLHLALPALLFNALSRRTIGEILHGPYLAAYALGSLLLLLVGFVWHRLVAGRSMSYSGTMTMGMVCPNSGFVGYPIALLTLGASTAGVALALNMMVENLFIIPLLLMLSDMGGGKGRWHEILFQTLRTQLRNPLILAILAGIAASLLGWKPPTALARTIDLFAQASGALSLFVIGGSLVGLQVQGLKLPVAQVALGKLLLHPLAMLLVLGWLIPVVDPALHTALLLTSALPMMGIYTILAQRHGHEGVASAALLATTLASFVTLSALLWGLRQWPAWVG
jgi:malonate transporter and related proteins